MKWVAITGGIACGKSTVSEILKQKNFSVIDSDQLAHQALAEDPDCFQSVVDAMGQQLVGPDGSLDRRKLGALVFADPQKLRVLESIVHPWIRKKTSQLRAQLEAKNVSIAFYQIPLLYEKNLAAEFDIVVVVGCSEEQQRQRLRSRDQMTPNEIENRLSAQIPLREKIKKADFVINNEGSKKELEAEVTKWLDQILATT